MILPSDSRPSLSVAEAVPAAEPVPPDLRRARLRRIAREAVTVQLPLAGGVFLLGIAAAYLQHGFLPGGTMTFPIAGVAVSIWHLLGMGVATGYAMAVVGQAAGILALPYSVAVLQFSTPAVSPTIQLMTLVNPLGALLGFRRNGQWNRDFALWVCAGGLVGGLAGPFLRVTLLAEPGPFVITVGLALVVAGANDMLKALWKEHMPMTTARPPATDGAVPVETDSRERPIATIRRADGILTIAARGHVWHLRMAGLFWTGAAVGVVSSALGVGGGFLLVPLLALLYRLPMSVLVAATIPYAILLSAAALVTYVAIVPLIFGQAVVPELAWGLIAAAGGIVGSWLASKTQHLLPERALQLLLGTVTLVGGGLMALDHVAGIWSGD